nr:retbindin [Cavia porcellus]
MACKTSARPSGLAWVLTPALAWILLGACGGSHPPQARSQGCHRLATEAGTGELHLQGEFPDPATPPPFRDPPPPKQGQDVLRRGSRWPRTMCQEYRRGPGWEQPRPAPGADQPPSLPPRCESFLRRLQRALHRRFRRQLLGLHQAPPLCVELCEAWYGGSAGRGVGGRLGLALPRTGKCLACLRPQKEGQSRSKVQHSLGDGRGKERALALKIAMGAWPPVREVCAWMVLFCLLFVHTVARLTTCKADGACSPPWLPPSEDRGYMPDCLSYGQIFADGADLCRWALGDTLPVAAPGSRHCLNLSTPVSLRCGSSRHARETRPSAPDTTGSGSGSGSGSGP